MKQKIDILEERCERFANILRRLGFVNVDDVAAAVSVGELTPGDARYLFGLQPLSIAFDDLKLRGDVKFERGCDERNVWGKKETGMRLCKDCPATFESKCICQAVKKRTYVVFNE